MSRGGSDNLPVNLTLAYLILSVLWIIGSDTVTVGLQLPAEAQTLKGWFFVALTSFLLYRTLRNWQTQVLKAEGALIESETRLRQVADTIQDVFWLTDPLKSEILFISPAYQRIWGSPCQRLDLHPRSWLESIVPEDRQRVLQALPLQVLGTYDITYRIRTPEGEERWIHDRAFPIADETGKVFRVAGVARDISSERATAQALRESEDKYRCLVELSPEGVGTLIEGQLTFANPAMLKLFGAASRRELVGRPILELVHPSQLEAARRAVQEVQEGVSVITPLSRHFQRLDGTDFHGEILASPFSRDGRKGAIFLIRDVSERNKVGAALEQHRSHLQAIIQNSSDCIVAVDPSEKVLWLNPAAEKCFKISNQLACGRPWGHFLESETSGIRADGGRFPLELKISTVNLADGPVKTVVLRDISERLSGEQKRKDLELQLRHSQKMEALGLLAGGVAHDFNNLLTVILGAATLVETGRPEDSEHREAILQAAERAAGLTRQLLLFSRKQVVKLEDLDVNELFDGITGMLRRLLGDQIRLTTQFAPSLSQVRADAGMLEQVLINLVVNSRDAVGNGGSVTVRTLEVLKQEADEGDVLKALPGRYVCLEVEDNGSGIDPKDLPHIFDPFFTTKDVGKGTGLGLATVYGIMEQHEGGLQVFSQPGRGTRIRAIFPALSSPKAGGPKAPELHLARGQGRVLVAEDDPALQRLILKVLKRCGYAAVGASNALEALDSWHSQSETFDFLVTDLIMPGSINGFELARRLQLENPSLRVIFCSGYSVEWLEAGGGLGEGERFLAKPYTPKQLTEALAGCPSPLPG